MAKVCNACGNVINDGDAFCKACGASAPVAATTDTFVNNPVQPVQPVQQQPYNQPYNQTQPQPVKGKTVGTAIGALVCGIIGLLILPIPMGIVALSLGLSALNHLKSFPNDGGKGMAIAGVVIGSFNIIYGVLALVIALGK